MIQIIYSRDYLKSAKWLPKARLRKLSLLLKLLSTNPYHPLLHTKRLSKELTGYLSFRITRDWRVIFQFVDEETIMLLRVANRKGAYR